MKKLHLIILLVPIVFFSCKKKEFPEPIKEEPVFFMKASIDGQPLEFTAGENDYYMYSGFYQDSSLVYHFTSELKNKNCSNAVCPGSIKISMSDDKASHAGGSSNISNSIKPGNYAFETPAVVTPSLIGYAVSFRSEINTTPYGYSWSFGDGYTSTQANPTHTFLLGGVYNTCVSITDSTSTTGICNKIKVTTDPGTCQTIILIGGVTMNTIAFSQYTGGLAPFTYKWNFGDGNYSTQASPVHTYSLSGLYLVNLSVKDAKNDSASFNYYINTQFSNQAAPNFSVTNIQPVYEQVAYSIFSKANITYTDANGKVYSSRTQNQQNESYFKIESVRDYNDNAQGEKTKKLKIKVSCKLFNGNTSVNLVIEDATIAIAYK